MKGTKKSATRRSDRGRTASSLRLISHSRPDSRAFALLAPPPVAVDCAVEPLLKGFVLAMLPLQATPAAAGGVGLAPACGGGCSFGTPPAVDEGDESAATRIRVSPLVDGVAGASSSSSRTNGLLFPAKGGFPRSPMMTRVMSCCCY